MKNNKGNTMLVLLLIIALVVFAFWWLVKSGYKFPGQTAQGPAITGIGGLNNAGKQLDGTNPDQMDPALNQVAKDSTSF